MRCIHFDVTDSTNEQARRLAAVHPGEVMLITADEQSAGRGRRGRVWQSPRGGAWLSLVHPLRRPPAAYAGASLAAAVAVQRAIVRRLPELAADLRIKWPNDLLIAGRKVAGILCEQLPLTANTPGTLIIGVGVNVDFDVATLAGELRQPAASLGASANGRISVAEVVAAVADELEKSLAEFEANGLSGTLIAELRAALADVGQRRIWTSPSGSLTGRVLGLDDEGQLLLETPAGVISCNAGELLPETPNPANS